MVLCYNGTGTAVDALFGGERTTATELHADDYCRILATPVRHVFDHVGSVFCVLYGDHGGCGGGHILLGHGSMVEFMIWQRKSFLMIG